RLHDVHTREVEQPTPVDEAENEDDDEKNEERVNRNPSKPKHYRKFGALGKAFRLKNCPAIVLIDEIDKADLDFPNDLLAVLDEPWEFKIKETGETIRATYPSKDDRDSDTEADV
ncbi:MAG: AAA family ATPase, partial [Microcystis panniformis]